MEFRIEVEETPEGLFRATAHGPGGEPRVFENACLIIAMADVTARVRDMAHSAVYGKQNGGRK